MKTLFVLCIVTVSAFLPVSLLHAQTGTDYGTSTFTVNGALSGSFQGTADFVAAENFGVNTFEISMNDRSPQTFSLQIMRQSSEPAEVPVAGAYTIGMNDGTGSAFTAIFVDTSEGFAHAAEYTTLFDDATGELVIELSENGRLSGFFRFTATNLETGDRIEVSEGSFSAVERRY